MFWSWQVLRARGQVCCSSCICTRYLRYNELSRPGCTLPHSHENSTHIWAIHWPTQQVNVLFSKPMLCHQRCVLQVIVLLEINAPPLDVIVPECCQIQFIEDFDILVCVHLANNMMKAANPPSPNVPMNGQAWSGLTCCKSCKSPTILVRVWPGLVTATRTFISPESLG